MIPQLPYFLIGNVIALGLCAYAFYEAGTGGRIALLVLVGATFLVPRFVGGLPIKYWMISARMVLGIGSYFYIRWKNS